MPATANHRSMHPCLVCNDFVPHTLDFVIGSGIGHRKLIVHLSGCKGVFLENPLPYLPTGTSQETRTRWEAHAKQRDERRAQALDGRTAVEAMPVARVVAFPPSSFPKTETAMETTTLATEPAATQGADVETETLSIKQTAKALKTTENYLMRLMNHQRDFPRPVTTGPYTFSASAIKAWDEAHPFGDGGRRKLTHQRKPDKRTATPKPYAGPTTRVTLEIATADFELAQKLAERLSEYGADVKPVQILAKALHKGLAS